MPIVTLPPHDVADQIPGYDFLVDLADLEYRIRLRWMDRQERWYLDLWDSAGDPMLRGQRLVPGTAVGHQYTGRAPRGGVLFFWDLDDSGTPCGYEDLGSRCKLTWISEEEYASP